MDDVFPADDATPTDTAHEVNARIRLTAESLSAAGDGDFHYTFFCECGCMRTVSLTLAEFAARGALVDGHNHA